MSDRPTGDESGEELLRGEILTLALDSDSGDLLLADTRTQAPIARLTDWMGSPDERMEFLSAEWEERSVSILSRWRNILMMKRVSTLDDLRVLRIDYGFRNESPVFIRSARGSRFQLPPDRIDEWRIPVAGGIRLGGAPPVDEIHYFRPSGAWLEWREGGNRFRAQFSEGVHDGVEAKSHQGRLSLTSFTHAIGLQPGGEVFALCLLRFSLSSADDAFSDDELRLHDSIAPVPFAFKTPDNSDDNAASPSEKLRISRSNRRLQDRRAHLRRSEEVRIEILKRWRDKNITTEEALFSLRFTAENSNLSSESIVFE